MVSSSRIKEDIKNHMKTSLKDDDEILKYMNRISICDDVYQSIEKSNLVVVCTEWDQFIKLDWNKIYQMMGTNPWVFDGRNLLDRKKIKKIGFKTFFIGH